MTFYYSTIFFPFSCHFSEFVVSDYNPLCVHLVNYSFLLVFIVLEFLLELGEENSVSAVFGHLY